MNDPLEGAPFFLIGKHNVPKRSPIESAGCREDRWAKSFCDFNDGRLTGCRNLMRKDIRIKNGESLFRQTVGNRCFAAANCACEPDRKKSRR